MNIWTAWRLSKIQRATDRNIRRMNLGESQQEFNARLRRNHSHSAVAWALIVLGFASVVFSLLNYPT